MLSVSATESAAIYEQSPDVFVKFDKLTHLLGRVSAAGMTLSPFIDRKKIILKTRLYRFNRILNAHSKHSAHSNVVLDDSLITAHTISLIAP